MWRLLGGRQLLGPRFLRVEGVRVLFVSLNERGKDEARGSWDVWGRGKLEVGHVADGWAGADMGLATDGRCETIVRYI